MDLMGLERKSLTLEFIRDGRQVVAVVQQWLAWLNDGGTGNVRFLGLSMGLKRIEESIDLAARSCRVAAKYREDIAKGRAPSFDDAFLALEKDNGAEDLWNWEQLTEGYLEFLTDFIETTMQPVAAKIPGEGFRQFFLEDQPELSGMLSEQAQQALSQWFESSEFRTMQEEWRQRWLAAGIDIDRHSDPVGQLRVLISKCDPRALEVSGIDWTVINDTPPSEWFGALFELASQPESPREPVKPRAIEAVAYSHGRTKREWLEVRDKKRRTLTRDAWLDLIEDGKKTNDVMPETENGRTYRFSRDICLKHGFICPELSDQLAEQV